MRLLTIFFIATGCFLYGGETVIKKFSASDITESKKVIRLKNEWSVKGNETLFTCDVPGNGWRKMKLVFKAKVEGEKTFESNPLYELMPDKADLPSFSLTMLNAEGKAVRNMRAPQYNAIGSGDWQEYGRIFYLQPNETKFSFGVNTGKNPPVQLKDFVLSRLNEGPELSINGDFQFAAGKYSGISHFERMGRMETPPDQQMQLNTMPQGHVSLEPLPVVAGKPYLLTVTFSETPARGIRGSMSFVSASGERIRTNVFYLRAPATKKQRKAPDFYEQVIKFAPPPNAEAVEISFYAGIITKISLKEDK